MAYKYKYLRVRVKPDNFGETVCRVDVSQLNKKGIELEWDRLDKKYPVSAYISCFEQTNDKLPLFENDPVSA